MKSIALLFLVIFIFISQLLNAQLPDSLDAKQWAKAFSEKNDRENEALKKIPTLLDKDSVTTYRFLDELEKQGSENNNYFQARFNCLKAGLLQFFDFFKYEKVVTTEAKSLALKKIDSLMAISINKAYSTEDDYLIAFISNLYTRSFVDNGLRIMYSLNSIALYEKLSLDISPDDYQLLGTMLYGVREYDSCIKYTHKALEIWQKSPAGDSRPVNCLNTIALCYHKKEQYDSAFKYYRQALQTARALKDTPWVGFVSGNMAQIYYGLKKYDTARMLFMLDYDASASPRFYDELSNAKQWLARVDLAQGNKTNALTEVRDAYRLYQLNKNANYLRNIYHTTSDVFKAMSNYDSAFYYNNLYSALNDSLERIVAANSLSISRARINDLNSRYNIEILNREKQSEITTRNIMVGSVVLFAIIALLLVNSKRLKTKLEKEKAEQEKLLLQQEMESAQQQLRIFTDNIVEKSALIEKLQQQQEVRPVNTEQDVIVQELVQKSILTEADWLHFKTLFEKAHPGFFARLKEQANDITLAEIRMAALTRMQLTTRQMADVLGISANSIVKAKQRLRQRFNLQTNYEVEEFIAKL